MSDPWHWYDFEFLMALWPKIVANHRRIYAARADEMARNAKALGVKPLSCSGLMGRRLLGGHMLRQARMEQARQARLKEG